MQIPKYSDRIVVNPTARTKMEIQEPKTFGDTSYLREQTNAISRTAEGMTNVYLQMKQDRDNGIVDEFMNNYSIDSTNKLRELKQQYNGANAEGIIDAYNEWKDNYLTEHLTVSDKDKSQLYLENKEQIEAAKKSLNDKGVVELNHLSNYAASELETYKKNQLQDRIDGLQEAISHEDNIDNIKEYMNEIDGLFDTHFPEQSIQARKERQKAQARIDKINKEEQARLIKLEKEKAKEQKRIQKEIETENKKAEKRRDAFNRLMQSIDKDIYRKEIKGQKNSEKRARALDKLLNKLDNEEIKQEKKKALERAKKEKDEKKRRKAFDKLIDSLKKEQKKTETKQHKEFTKLMGQIDRDYKKQVAKEKREKEKLIKQAENEAKAWNKEQRKIYEDAIVNNIKNDITSNPWNAALKLNSEEFLVYIQNKNTLTSLQSNTRKSLINSIAEQRARDIVNEQPIQEVNYFAIDSILQPIGGVDKFEAEVNKKAKKIAKDYKKEIDTSNVDYMIKLHNVTTKGSNEDRAQLVSELAQGNPRLQQDAKTYADVVDKYNDYYEKFHEVGTGETLAEFRESNEKINEWREKQETELKNSSVETAVILDNIENGIYTSIEDINNIEKLHPANAKRVLDAFINELKFKKFVNVAKVGGINVENYIKNNFKSFYSTTKASGILYDYYKNEMKDAIINFQNQTGKTPNEGELRRVSNDVNNQIMNNHGIILSQLETLQQIYNTSRSTRGNGRIKSRTSVINGLIEGMTPDNGFGDLSDKQKKNIADMVISGNINAVWILLEENNK